MRIARPLDWYQESPLAQIPDQTVSFRYKRISLKDFLKEISGLIPLNVEIDRDLSNEKLCIIVNKISIRHLLRHIATLYRGQWEQTATGIALRRTSDEHQLESSFVSALKQARLQYWQTQFALKNNDVSKTVEEFYQQRVELQESGVSTLNSPLSNCETILLKAFLSDWTRNEWDLVQRGFPIMLAISVEDVRLQRPKGALAKALWEMNRRLRILDDYSDLYFENKDLEINNLILIAYMTPDFATLRFIVGLERSDGQIDLTGLQESVPDTWLVQNKLIAQHPIFLYWQSWSTPNDKYTSLTTLQKVVSKGLTTASPQQLALQYIKHETTADFLERLAQDTGLDVIADAYRKPLLSPIQEPGGKALAKLLWFLDHTKGWMRIEDGVLLFRHWNYPELSLSEISEQEWYQIERKILNNSINTKIILNFLKNKRLDQQARFQEGVETSEQYWEVVNSDLFLFLSSLTQSQLERLQYNGLPFPQLSAYQRFSLYKVLLGYHKWSSFSNIKSSAILRIVYDKNYAYNVMLHLNIVRDRYTDQRIKEKRLYYREKVDLILFLPNNMKNIISAEIRYPGSANSLLQILR